MGSEGQTPPRSSPARAGDAKAYHRRTLAAGIISSLLSLALLLALGTLRAGQDLASWCSSILPHPYGALLLYACAAGMLEGALTLPAAWYAGFHLEHAFALSTQTAGAWAWERLKGILVAAPVASSVACVFYFCLMRFGESWWFPAGLVLTLLAVVMARIAPVIILPLFYRCTPLREGALKESIVKLAESAGVRPEGVFSFNLSRTTRKANAALTGIGRSRRIILGDTLLGSFSDEEIETVFAHELGHLRLRHIMKGILFAAAMTFAVLYAASLLYPAARALAHAGGPTDLASLPLLALCLSLAGMAASPLGKVLSRAHERQADAYAVRATGKRAAFVSALRKLAAMNLADPSPHPVVEFLFYSHPPVARRIEALPEGRS